MTYMPWVLLEVTRRALSLGRQQGPSSTSRAHVLGSPTMLIVAPAEMALENCPTVTSRQRDSLVLKQRDAPFVSRSLGAGR